MNEEILFKMGADNRPLARGLRGMKGMVSEAMGSMKSMFVGAFTVGAIISEFNKLRTAVEDIRRISESTGLDTGFVQDLKNAAEAAGLTGDAIEGMLDKFVKNLAPGSDPEVALFRLINQFKDIQDPAERADMAVENFGKTGIKLIPILEQGVQGLREMGDEFGRISESQMQMIEHADDILDRFGIKIKVWFANIIEGFSILNRVMQLFIGGIGTKNMMSLDKAIEQAQQEADDRFNAANNEAERKRVAQREAIKKQREKEKAERDQKNAIREQDFQAGINLRKAVERDKRLEEFMPVGQIQSGKFDPELAEIGKARQEVINQFNAGNVLALDSARKKLAQLQQSVGSRITENAKQGAREMMLQDAMAKYFDAALNKGIKVMVQNVEGAPK